MGRVAMASLSLREAAEQTGTSKVDIWCAIRAGRLLAKKTEDGGFAIEPAELFGVFEPQRPDQCPTGQDTKASPEALGRPETDVTPETAATNDIAVAFAALQVELTSLLGRVAEVPANDERREDNHENRSSEQLDFIAGKPDHLREEAAAATSSSSAAIEKTETRIPTPTNEEVVETARKRSWWRRLVR
jgi:hypothetical protein